MSYKDKIDSENLPRHIAIIMDGNGRWAKKQGKIRIFGHEKGVIPVRECSEAAAELGIEYLTLYAFSTENWNRPKSEINALMGLLVKTINKEVKTLNENKIKLNAIGDIQSLPKETGKKLMEAIDATKSNDRMTLTLALSYSSRWEITQAVKRIASEVKSNNLDIESINSDLISSYLETADIPNPELLIRTSGEQRISNYLLWQIAYSELLFEKKLWPEYRKEDLYKAIVEYQHRERRFGKTSEQCKNGK